MQRAHLLSEAEYAEQIRSNPETLWQSLEWKQYQEALGREVRLYGTGGKVTGATALVVIDRTIGGFSTWDIPRGPNGTSEKEREDLLSHIVTEANESKCIQLSLSPRRALPLPHSFAPSNRHTQPEATRIVDLSQTEELILAQMHPKGRYNIQVAKKHGIEIVQGSAENIDAFYTLLRATSQRDGFQISSRSHYQHFLSDLTGSFLLMALHDKKPIAGLLGVMWKEQGVYYYGASDHQHRHLMAPYLLQWEAMKLCKANGCTQYDLFGIAPPDAKQGNPWLGISDFKRKFGGEVVLYPTEQIIVLRPIIKVLLGWKRKMLG